MQEPRTHLAAQLEVLKSEDTGIGGDMVGPSPQAGDSSVRPNHTADALEPPTSGAMSQLREPVNEYELTHLQSSIEDLML